MPRESLDAPENLPKKRRRQVAFGKLEDEVPSMPDEAPPGLEEPLLEARLATTRPLNLRGVLHAHVSELLMQLADRLRSPRRHALPPPAAGAPHDPVRHCPP